MNNSQLAKVSLPEQNSHFCFFFFFNLNLQSLAILPSLTSKINVPIITVCNKQRRIFTVIMIWKKWICSTCCLKKTYSFTSGGFPCDRSASTSGMQINTKPNWKTNNEIRQINTTDWFIQQIDVLCYWKQVGLLPTTELYKCNQCAAIKS